MNIRTVATYFAVHPGTDSRIGLYTVQMNAVDKDDDQLTPWNRTGAIVLGVASLAAASVRQRVSPTVRFHFVH